MGYTLVIGNQNYSSWSLRPWLAMHQFGIPFQQVRLALYQPDTASQLNHYSPTAKVPVLIHDGTPIWESLAILEYLAEQHPQFAWWPADRQQRATARSLSAEMHAGFQALRHDMPMNCRKIFPPGPISSAVQQDIERMTQIWRTCRQQSEATGAFLFGPFGIVDAMFAPVVLRFRTYSVALDAPCQAYAEAILALPGMQTWLQAAEVEPEVLPQYER
jgi:glutathione S-transferase